MPELQGWAESALGEQRAEGAMSLPSAPRGWGTSDGERQMIEMPCSNQMAEPLCLPKRRPRTGRRALRRLLQRCQESLPTKG